MSSHSPHGDSLPKHGSVVYVLQFLNPFDEANEAALGVAMKVKDARLNFLRIYKTTDDNSEKQIIPQIAEDQVWWLKDKITEEEKATDITKKEFVTSVISSILHTLKYEFNLDYYLLQSRDRDEIFCKIFVTDEWAKSIAIETEYTMQFRIREKFVEEFQQVGPYGPATLLESREKNEGLFKRYDAGGKEVTEGGSLFTHTDKSRLLIEFLMRRVDLHALKSTGVMIEDFCVHEEAPLNDLRARWASFSALFKSQPIDDVRTYFAEKITLYFAWIGTYWTFMTIAAVVGLSSFIGMRVFGNNTVEGASFQIFFAIFLAMWGSAFEQNWRRHEKRLAWRWGTTELSSQESQRPEFKGSFGKDEVTGKMKILPLANEGKCFKKCVVYSIVALSCITVVVAVSFIFLLRYTLNQDTETQKFARIVPAFLNALQIRILNIIYGKIVTQLNDWENHETDNQHNDSLALKMFLFKFVNSYTALFYMAFFKENFESKDYCVDKSDSNVDCNDATILDKIFKVEPGCKDCLGDLGFQLAVIFITNMIMNVMELGLPWLKWKIKIQKEANKVAQSSDPNMRKDLYPVEYDSKLEPYETPLDDYMEMIVQFGYVAMFGVASPIIALLALIEITLEIRVDAWKLCNLTRRPDPNRSDSIGVWLDIILAIAYAGAVTNAAIMAFTSTVFDQFDPYISVLMFLLIEHAFIVLMYIVGAYVPDIPHTVQDGLDWGKRLVSEKLISWKENAKEVHAEYSSSQGHEHFLVEKNDLHYQE